MGDPKKNSPTSAQLTAEAFALVVMAREKLVAARAARAPGAEVVPDAAALGKALLSIGGAIPQDSAPWILAEALGSFSGIPDEDGTDLLQRFMGVVISAFYATRRRKALKLTAPGLERFVAVASKNPTRKATIEALHAMHAEDEATRQREQTEEAKRQRSVGAQAQVMSTRPKGQSMPSMPDEEDPKV